MSKEYVCRDIAWVRKAMPFLQGYCRDISEQSKIIIYLMNKIDKIKLLYNVSRYKIIDEDKIDSIKSDVMKRAGKICEWIKELNDMGIASCNEEMGFIDIMITDIFINDVVLICLGPDDFSDSLYYHDLEENYSNRRTYWE